jgi:hypothetical protein
MSDAMETGLECALSPRHKKHIALQQDVDLTGHAT